MIDFYHFYQIIENNNLSHWLDILPTQIITWQRRRPHRKFIQWYNTVKNLPKITPTYINLLNGVCADIEPHLYPDQLVEIKKMLRTMMPWRKGPFSLYGIHINTEWHSDWKWDRLLPHFSSLSGRIVLDVGCGNGYHLWRMVGAGAKLAIGIDPMQLFFFQFEAIRKLLGADQRAHLLPLCIEQLPDLEAFDTVYSMGVLYHRRFPIKHIYKLKNQLVPNGELILETLIIAGGHDQVLVPDGCYAKMNNVYSIPSISTLTNMLDKCGFVDIRVVNVCATSTKEQRRTSWMTSESLREFLDPNDHQKTVEGYPAPLRVIILAKKPH